MRTIVAAIPVAAFLLGSAQALAAPSYATPVAPSAVAPPLGSTVMTSRGAGVVTGSFGSTAIASLPGTAAQGLVMNNGDGSSTLIAPGLPPQEVPTP